MAQIYYPLLKFGFQKTGGGGEAEQIAALQEAVSVLQQQAATLQTALNTLKGKKITKCFSSTDFATLETNEIFEWQGETTTIDGTQFVNGFFYKKIVGQQTLPSGTTYFLYEQNEPTITQNEYVFTPGNYYHLDTITPANGSNFYNYALYQWNGISRYYFLLTIGVNLQVGDLVWDNQNYTFVTVDSLDDNGNPTLSNGEYISASGKTGGLFVEIIECKNSDGTAFSFIRSNSGRLVVHYTLVNNVFTLIDWFYVYVVTRTTTTPQTIGVDTYTQTNTQLGSSYTLPKATSNLLGGVVIGDYLDNSNALTLDFTFFGTGDDEMPDVNDNYFEVEIGTLWFHIFVFKVACTDNFSSKSHRIIIPFNFVSDFGGYIYDENLVCIGHYTLSGNSLTIYKTDISTDFSLMDGFTFIAFR